MDTSRPAYSKSRATFIPLSSGHIGHIVCGTTVAPFIGNERVKKNVAETLSIQYIKRYITGGGRGVLNIYIYTNIQQI